jgi:hypothetical protein
LSLVLAQMAALALIKSSLRKVSILTMKLWKLALFAENFV